MRIATERVGDFDLSPMLEKFDSELIYEEWQLEYLDSLQWLMLGVPIGVVASVKRYLEEKNHHHDDHDDHHYSHHHAPAQSAIAMAISSSQRSNHESSSSHSNGMSRIEGSLNHADDDNEEVSLLADTPFPPPMPLLGEWTTTLRQPISSSSPSPSSNLPPLPPRPGRRPSGMALEDSPLSMPRRRESALGSIVGDSHHDVGGGGAGVVQMAIMSYSNAMNSPPILPVRCPSVSSYGGQGVRRQMSELSWGSLDDTSDVFAEPAPIPVSEEYQESSTPPPSLPDNDESISQSTLLSQPLISWIDRIIASSSNELTSSENHLRGLDLVRQALLDGVEIKTRRYGLKTYPDCFVASEMVDFMMNKGWAETRDAAVYLGQCLQFQFQWFEHVVEPRRHWFSDRYLFFKFN